MSYYNKLKGNLRKDQIELLGKKIIKNTKLWDDMFIIHRRHVISENELRQRQTVTSLAWAHVMILYAIDHPKDKDDLWEYFRRNVLTPISSDHRILFRPL
jgi:hypothetical protein